MIAPGDKVFLRACSVGQLGTVIRAERRKFTVYWADMDFWSRHRPEALELASTAATVPDATEAFNDDRPKPAA